MRESSSKLKQYFMELQQIQEMHMADFDNDADLGKMIFERDRAFSNLKNAISQASRAALKEFSHEASSITDKDKIFMATLREYKENLFKTMHHHAKGKHLLRAYRGCPSKSMRFMNLKG